MITCLRPQKFYQPYLERDIVSNCGECSSCLCSKADRYQQLCFQLEKQYKFTLFFTLTYDEDSLPRVAIVRQPVSDTHCFCRFISTNLRTKEYGEILCDKLISYKDLYSITEKVGLNDYLPYCSTRDLQLFLKRFRRNLYKRIPYNEQNKIKYFMVSEYGPEHLRSHAHGLFFFDSREILSFCGEILSQSWKLGFINFSLSRGGVSSYVSKYVNSLSNVPDLFKERGFRAKQIHSTGFFQSKTKEFKEKVYESDYRRIIRNGLQVNKYYIAPFQGSLAHYFFPKCKGFTRSTFSELYKLYTFAPNCRLFFSGSERSSISLTSLAENLSTILLDVDFSSRNKLFDIVFSCLYKPLKRYDYDELKVLIYRLLITSSHFINFCCNGSTNINLIKLRISQIQHFWYCMDMYRLENWYQDVNLYLENRSPFVLFMYDDFLKDDFSLNPLIKFGNSKSNRHYLSFLESFDKLPFSYVNVKRINDKYFDKSYSASRTKLFNHLKHVKLTDKIFNL